MEMRYHIKYALIVNTYVTCVYPTASGGQFKFTQLWNGIIQYLQENVEVKRRKHKMRSYDNCFTGTDAVDILHHYLEHHGGLEHNVTHENVVKVCQVCLEVLSFILFFFYAQLQ